MATPRIDCSLRPMNSHAERFTSMTRPLRATITGVGIAWIAACQPNFVGLLIRFRAPRRAWRLSGCWRPSHHTASSHSGNANAKLLSAPLVRIATTA